MKKITIALAALLAAALSAPAAENYTASLKAGDGHRDARNTELALSEYGAAAAQAANGTERALAIGKKAVVFAYDQRNYAAARVAAEEALRIPDIAPVARVTALQVLAECLIKADKNYPAAAKLLEEAAQLPDVDWAQAAIALSLGDCYRLSGQFDQALSSLGLVMNLPTADDNMKAIANLNMGFTYQYGLQDAEKARAAYAKAVALKPALKAEIDTHLAKLAP